MISIGLAQSLLKTGLVLIYSIYPCLSGFWDFRGWIFGFDFFPGLFPYFSFFPVTDRDLVSFSTIISR